MEANTAELAIYRGATCEYEFSFVDDTDAIVPFPAGSKAYLEVRAAPGVDPPWLSLSSDDAGPPLVVNAAGGTVTIHLTPAQTSAIDPAYDRQTGVFDLLVGTVATDLPRYLSGTCYIQEATTQVVP